MEQDREYKNLINQIIDLLSPIDDDLVKSFGLMVFRKVNIKSYGKQKVVRADLVIKDLAYDFPVISLTENGEDLHLNLHAAYANLSPEQSFLAKSLAAKSLLTSIKNIGFTTSDSLNSLFIEEASYFFKNILLPNNQFLDNLKNEVGKIKTHQIRKLVLDEKTVYLN